MMLVVVVAVRAAHFAHWQITKLNKCEVASSDYIICVR